MKHFFTLAVIAILYPLAANAQWCTPTATAQTMNSYSANSPTITNVTFNTINRTSSHTVKELYLLTSDTTEVELGDTVQFSMEYSQDLTICSQYYLRVWIDWNIDGDFDDAGELALTEDQYLTTTWDKPIIVPTTADTGVTRMRVAMKMDQACGHTPPEPCVPNESFGWHGEIEDYSIVLNPVVATEPPPDVTGIGESLAPANIQLVTRNGQIGYSYTLQKPTASELRLYDVTGKQLDYKNMGMQDRGQRRAMLSTVGGLAQGVYILELRAEGHRYAEKIMLTE